MKNAESGLLGKMATTSFWANDLFDGLAYAASAFVPGALIGKGLGLGAKALSTSQMAKSLGWSIKGIDTGAKATNLALSTAYNTIAEASVEAYQTKQEIERLLLDQGHTEEYAKQKAGEAAARTFRANTVVLSAPNLVQNILFHGGLGKSQKAIREAIRDGKALDDIAKVDNVWKSVGLGIGSEGFWEENVQISIQQYERMAAVSGQYDKNYLTEVGGGVAKGIKSFFKGVVGWDDTPEETEQAVSVFLGSLIGGGMGAYSNVRERKQREQLITSEQDRFKKILEAGDIATKLMGQNISSIYKVKGTKTVKEGDQDIEIREFDLDADGNPLIDEDKLLQLVTNQLANKHLWDAEMLAAYRNDPTLKEFNKHQALASYAWRLIAAGAEQEEVEHLINKLEVTAESEAAALGVDKILKDNLNLVKQYAKDLQSIMDKRGSSASDLESTKFTDWLNKTEFYLKAKMNSLTELFRQATTEQGKNTINALIEDTAAQLSDISERPTELRKLYKETIFDPETRLGDIKRLEKLQDKTPEQIEELNRMLYDLAENNFVNGRWVESQGSRTLPSGAELFSKARINLGSRDMLRAATGRTIAALDRITEAMAEQNPDYLRIARDFNNNVIIRDDPNVKVIQDKLLTEIQKLSDENDQVVADNEFLYGVTNILGTYDYADGSSTLRQVIKDVSLETGRAADEADADVLTDEIIGELNNAGLSVNGTEVFTEEWIDNNIDALNAALANIQDNQDRLQSYSENVIQKNLEEIKTGQLNAKKNKRLTDYKDAALAGNENQFLEQDFYDITIGNPVQSLIDDFKSNSDDFDRDEEFEIAVDELRKVIDAYKYRLQNTDKYPSVSASISDDANLKLQFLLQTVGPKLQDNVSKRAEVHKITNNNLVLGGLRSLGLVPSSNARLKTILETVLTKEVLDKLLQDVFSGQDILSFDALNLIIITAYNKADTDTKEQILEALEEYQEQQIDYTVESIDGIKAGTRASIKKNLASNTAYNIQFLIRKYFGDEVPDIVTKYLYDQDLGGLARFAKSASGLSEADAKVIEKIDKLSDLITMNSIMRNFLEIGVTSYDKFVKQKESIDEQFSPSLQQNIALTQALLFLTSFANNNNYRNWLLVRGIGGAGKTFLMGPTLLKLYQEQIGHNAKVYAFSKHKHTTDNVNNAVFGKTLDNSLSNLLAMSDTEIAALDFILIDEIFTFTNDEISQISVRLGEVSENTAKVVRVIALGDPSQATAEDESDLMSGLNTQFTIPLTTSYRTNVSAIAAFNRNFQLKPKTPVQPRVQSNMSVEDAIKSPATALGVIAGSVKDLDAILRTPSTRSRVLIVDSQDAKSGVNYPGVKVLTIAEAQGHQWDEVYTLLDPAELGKDGFSVNRNLYTAYSRAKSFLFLAGTDAINAPPKADLDQSIATAQNELSLARDMFKSNLANANKAQDILKGVKAIKPEDLQPEEQVENEEGPAVESNTVVGPQYVESVEQEVEHALPTKPSIGNFNLSYPTNVNIRKHVAVNTEAHIVNTDSGKYYLIAPSIEQPGRFAVLGVLGDEDFKGPAGQFFSEVIKRTKPALSESSIPKTGVMDFPGIAKYSLGTIVIKNFTTFKTIRFGENRENYTNEARPLIAGAKDVVEDAFIRFYNSYYTEEANGAQVKQTNKQKEKWVTVDAKGNHTVHWDRISSDDAFVAIMSRNLEKKLVLDDIKVDYGLPYLIIRPKIVNKAGESKPAKHIVIKLQPKRFSKNSEKFKEIRKFLDAVKVVEAETGLRLGAQDTTDERGEPASELALMVREFKNNVLVVDSEKSKYDTNKRHYFVKAKDGFTPANALEQALLDISLAIFGVKYQTQFFNSEAEAQEFIDNNSVKDADGNDIVDGKKVMSISKTTNNKYNIQVSNDPTNEDDTVVLKRFQIVEGQGPAQIAFNTLAQANLYVGKHGQQFRKKVTSKENGNIIRLNRAESLLEAGQKFTDWEMLYQYDEIQEVLGDRAVNDPNMKFAHAVNRIKKAFREKRSDLPDPEGYAENIIELFTTQPVTVEFLEEIVGDNAFNEFNEHSTGINSLRTPLRISTSGKNGVNDLGSNLAKPENRAALNSDIRHNFSHFEHTSVTFGVTELIEEPPVDEKPIKRKLGEILAELKKTNNPVLDYLIDLFNSLPALKDVDVLYYPGGVPVLENDNVVKKHGVMAAGLFNGKMTIVTAVSLKNINKKPEVLSNLLHETLHILTKPALEKGLRDLKAKRKDTPEAIFYKRFSTLKKRFDSAIRSRVNPATGQKYKLEEVYAPTESKLDILEFVSNLSNPRFVQFAKDITLLPKGTRKSILREMIESIIEFFSKALGLNSNIYDAAITILEDFISIPSHEQVVEPTVALDENAIKKEVKNLQQTLLKELTAALSVDDEFLFDDNLETIQRQFGHIINLNTLPSYGERFKLEFTNDFTSVSDSEKLETLQLATASFTNLSYAYVNLPQEVVSINPGSIRSTKGTINMVDRILKNEDIPLEVKNILRSIALKEKSHPGLMTKISAAYAEDDMDSLRSIFYEEILSPQDKTTFILATKTSNNLDAGTKIFIDPQTDEEVEIRNNIYTAVKLLSDKYWTQLSSIEEQLEDRSLERYRHAKNYVLSIIKENLDRDGTDILIQTRDEITRKIESTGRNIPRIKELTKLLNEAYKRADTLREDSAARRQYNDLVFREIPNLEDELVGLTSLFLKDRRTGKLILNKVLEDIYPKYKLKSEEDFELALELQELAETDYVLKDRIDDEMKETANIAEHIKKYNKSYENTLSESMKDFLSNISISDRKITSSLAYVKTMQLAVSLDWSQGLEGSNGIMSQLNDLIVNTSSLSNLDLAIINNLRATIEKAVINNFKDGIILDPSIGIVSHKSDTGVIVYSAYRNKDTGTGIFTQPQLEALSKVDTNYELSPRFVKTADLYNWLRDKNPELTIPQFNRMFVKAEAINIVRGIQNTMASMKETDLYLGTRSNQEGLKFKFMRSKASGISFNIKETIRQMILDKYESGELNKFKGIFRETTLEDGRKIKQLEASNKEKDRELYIAHFFSQLGFRQDAFNIALKKKDLPDIISSINFFLDSVATIAAPDENIEELEVSEDVDQSKIEDIYDWIDKHIDGTITRFSELIGKSDTLYRNPSVRDSKGGKFYKYHEASWAYDTLLNLIDLDKNNAKFKGGTGKSTNRRVPDYLMTDYYKDNIFVTGNNKIFSIGEYEAARNEDIGSVTDYIRENQYFFYHRTFLQGFLDGLRQYNTESYYQFTFIPSDKPKHPLVRVGLLSDADILPAISKMLHHIYQKQGKTIDVANYNNSQINDLFRNFELGKRAIENLKVPLALDTIEDISKEVKRLMEKEASRILDNLLSEEIRLTFDSRTYTYIRKLKDKLNPDISLPLDKLSNSKSEKDESFSNRKNKEYSVDKNDVLALFDLFFKNNYVNSYFLNQLITGDYSAYKNDSSDVVKRFAGVFGPRIKPLVDDKIGMKREFRALILDDTTELTGSNREDYENLSEADTLNTTRKKLINLLYEGIEPEGKDLENFEKLMQLFSKNYKSTDGQGFIMPSRARELSRGFENSWGLGLVHKPLYFGVHAMTSEDGYSTGIPMYLKYSAVVLTDDIVTRFPALKKLRDRAEALNVDEVLFASAVKTGAPIVKDNDGNPVKDRMMFKDFVNMNGGELLNNIVQSSIINLDNRNYGFQHNPDADPTKGVSLFTQLLYFLNVYPDRLSNDYATTQEAAFKTYELLGELIKMGREKFEQEVSTKEDLKKFLLKKFEGPGAERALALLEEGISVNHPLLEKRAIVSIASGMEKAAIKTKFSGGKLVLQTAEGIDLYQDPKLFKDLDNKKARDLQYRMEEIDGRKVLVAEVIVPKDILTQEQINAISEGKMLYLLPDALGFRIPSTELHSAVPLRVVGVYSSKQSNVIIAPKELVVIHGSDFDVDALFVITKETFKEGDNLIISAPFLTGYINSLSKLFNELAKMEDNATPEYSFRIRTLRKNIKEASGLLSKADSESPGLTKEESDKLEQEFQNYVSTPQNLGNSNIKIVRKESATYSESKARSAWGAVKNVYYTTLTETPQWVPNDNIYGKAEAVLRKITDFLADNPELSAISNQLLKLETELRSTIERTGVLLGQTDAPVGYRMSNGKYVLNTDYLDEIEYELELLNVIDAALQDELIPILRSSVRSSIKKIRSAKEKYLRNRMIDIILDVISDPANKLRMVSPISFAPVTTAIDEIRRINDNLIPTTKYDLSNIEDSYKAYTSLTAGIVLTGAFANASKSFGYFARAGAAKGTQEAYDFYGKLVSTIKVLEAVENFDEVPGLREELVEILDEFLVVPELFNLDLKVISETKKSTEVAPWRSLMNSLRSKAREILKTSVQPNAIKTSPFLNKRYEFRIRVNGKAETFNRLATIDAKSKYSVTQVYDALTNEAIDNLKEGDLVRARINQNTGSAVIGLVALGVPMDIIVKLLYQPIFTPLVTGKVNNVDRWLHSHSADNPGLVASYEKELVVAAYREILDENNLDILLDEKYTKLFKNKTPTEIIELTQGEERITLLLALDLFNKGYKIGEDMRNMSNFLNILRTHDVFIEDIMQLDDNLINKIGSINYTEDGQMMLVPNSDFSFVIPDIFESAPHIKEAYIAHLSTREIISKHLKIHSDPIVEFSEEIQSMLPNLDTRDEQGRKDSLQEKLTNIRRSLGYYILTSLIDPVNVSPEIVNVGKEKQKYTLSKLRTFSNRVAKAVQKIKNFDPNNNDFLKNLTPVKHWKGMWYLSFKSGVNLSVEDIQEFALGFKALNKYHLNEDGEITKVKNPGNSISNVQRDLLRYAVLNYGLQFSNSNYSNYIPPKMLKVLDDRYNTVLDAIIAGESVIPKEHFVLSHIMQNAASLPYAANEHLDPAIPGNYSEKIKPVYTGKATINVEDGVGDTKEVTVHYDLATKLDNFKPYQYIRRGFGERIVVYRKVAETDTTAYYQKVGKVSDAFHLKHEGEYSTSNMFKPTDRSIEYHYTEKDTA